jgi:AcrR family transcriptional regulator
MNLRKDKSEKAKKLILEAAFKIVREEGFSELSANKIAQAANISKGAIFHHFSQMDELYIFMLDTLILQFEEDLDPAAFKSFKEYIEYTGKYTIQLLDEAPEVVTTLFYFILQSNRNEEYKTRIKNLFEKSFSAWAEKMEHFFELKLTPSKLKNIVRVIDLYFFGMSVLYLIFKDKKTYQNITNKFGDMLTQAIEEEEK